jgi:mono/diheme cytochrome c family protein
MEFPLYNAPYINAGMVIGINAVLHVIISHGVAIGLVFMVALAEYIGLKHGLEGAEKFTTRLVKLTVVIVTGIGAVTGVGIWFTTTALVPTGIGSMLRLFFWPWFAEWLIFVLEVAALLILYYKWDGWAGGKRIYRAYYGFAYAFLGSVSTVLISGILSFMLTSDGWPWNKSFWSAFINPSFLPQVILRLGGAYALGAMFAMASLLFMRTDGVFRRKMLGVYGLILLVSLTVAAVSTRWYFIEVPSAFKTYAIAAVSTPDISQSPRVFWAVNAAGLVVVAALSVAALARSGGLSKLLVLPALFAAFCFVAEYESIREFIRGPYLMPGYMYANQIMLDESEYLKKTGLLKNAAWLQFTNASQDETTADRYLFEQNCGICHTIGGVNDIGKRFRGRTEDGIAVIIGHTNEMAPFMPPFSGTEAERKRLAKYLYKISQQGR